MIYLNASKGLGDAIHLRAIVLHLLGRDEITVFTSWPDLFDDVAVTVRPLAAITDEEVLRSAAYPFKLNVPRGMSQFEMCCVQAGIDEPVALRLNRAVRNVALVAGIRSKAAGRPVLVYQPPKLACSAEQRQIQPSPQAFRDFVASKADHFRVRVGDPRYVEVGFESECELDLCGRTSVSDVLDVGTAADLFFSEPSYLTIMAEALERPYVCMFTRRAQHSQSRRIRNLTPERIFVKLGTAVYDE